MREPLITMRREMKFLIGRKQLELLKRRLSSVFEPDPHQGPDGYTIRSLYFDTCEDRFLAENNAGIESRKKYRIRTYLREPDFFSFEEKTTVNALKAKRSAKISPELAEGLSRGERLSLSQTMGKPVLQQVYALQHTELLQPRAIIEYDRYALVSTAGNVRITFDCRIRTSEKLHRFPDWQLALKPILPDDIELLEVKYDGLLPGYAARLLQADGLQQVAFSKYALCRDFLSNGYRLSGPYELQARF